MEELINHINSMTEQEIKKTKKLLTLQQEPNLALFDELEDLNNKLEGLQGILSNIDNKEVKTYEEEINTLKLAIENLTESVLNKDMVVNVESNAKELKMLNDNLVNLLNESKKEQSVNVKLIIK